MNTATFFPHVSEIISLSSFPNMLRIETDWNIALMARHHPGKKLSTKLQFQSYNMSPSSSNLSSALHIARNPASLIGYAMRDDLL